MTGKLTQKTTTLAKISILIAIFGALISLVSNSYILNKGFILSDDGWYVTLLRDMPSQAISSQFYYFFQACFGDQILPYRIISCLLLIISSLVFSLGAYCLFFDHKRGFNKLHFLGIFSLVISYTFYVNAISTPNYLNMNEATTNFSLGFLFMALSRFPSKILYIASGFFIMPLFFIMITNIALFPLILILIIIKTKSIKNVLYTVIGTVLFTIIYFLFLQDFTLFYQNFCELFSETIDRGEDEYGIIYLITWTLKSFVYIILRFFGLGLLLYIGYRVYSSTQRTFTKISLASFYIVALSSILLFDGKFLPLSYAEFLSVVQDIKAMRILNINTKIIPESIIGFSLLLILLNKNCTWIQRFQWLFLLSIPLLLGLGTNVDFAFRNIIYLNYLAIAPCFILFNRDNICNAKFFIILVGMLALYISAIIHFNKANWFGEVPLEQNTPFIGQDIYVESKTADLLQEVKQYIHPEDKVLVHMNWGAFYVTGATCIDYNFRAQPQTTLRILSEHYPELKELTIISLPYSDEHINEILDILKTYRDLKVERIELYNTILYKVHLSPLLQAPI